MSADWLTAEQLADRLQLSVATIWRYTRQGKLRALKVGNHYRYALDQVIDALGAPSVQSTQAKITYEEFLRLPEEPGLQLIDGLLVKEPSPTYSHQACLGALYLTLYNHVWPRKLGRVILSPFDVVLSEDLVLQPDISFVQTSRVHLIQEQGLFGAPDLAIEILSPSSRRYDEGRKRELYLQYGCQELWLVDLTSKTVTWHYADRDEWQVEEFRGHATLTSKAISELAIPLPHVLVPDSL